MSANKKIITLAGGTALLVAVGFVVVFLFLSIGPMPDFHESVEQNSDTLTREYEEDVYGGVTPEETIALFINALLKDDIALAGKYFLPYEQEERKDELLEIQARGLLGEMVNRLLALTGKYPLVEGNNSSFVFESYNTDGELTLQIILTEGPSKKWKIVDL